MSLPGFSPAAIPGAVADAIIAVGRRMDMRGWVPATAGNFSMRLGPGRIAITRSGCHKGFLVADQLMVVDEDGVAEEPGARPSAETGLHCGIYRNFPDARAALHGHSVPCTVLSRLAGDTLELACYELLKAFPGLATHDATVALPVLDNDQDIGRMQARLDALWAAQPSPLPGYLIRGHGLYVWGHDMQQALLRLEALEFMLACEAEHRRMR
jgi:methylthioribulose-1-phosphate dehydratase